MYNCPHTSHLVHLYRHRRDERRKKGGSHVSPPKLLVYKVTAANGWVMNSEQMGSHTDIWGLQLGSIGLLRNLLCLVPRPLSEASQVCDIVSLPLPAIFATPPSTPSRTRYTGM